MVSANDASTPRTPSSREIGHGLSFAFRLPVDVSMHEILVRVRRGESGMEQNGGGKAALPGRALDRTISRFVAGETASGEEQRAANRGDGVGLGPDVRIRCGRDGNAC